jgi:hypothetical protein
MTFVLTAFSLAQSHTQRSQGHHGCFRLLSNLFSSPTDVVNDNGRYHSQTVSRGLEVPDKRASGKREPDRSTIIWFRNSPRRLPTT